ncbi:MAG TPA: TonB-dependent receptor [Bryobacteraceae bacterium]|jgi:hypothetical protein
MKRLLWVLLFSGLTGQVGYAQIFATVRGTVVDPQEHIITAAKVILKAEASSWTASATTGEDGLFTMTAVPAGEYTIEIEHDDFRTMKEHLNVTIGSAPSIMFMMELGTVSQTTEVTAQLEVTNPDASSPPVSVSILDILHTPGADRASSLAFITDFVPGSYMLHDHLHMRGGHQVSWEVDGVPVPNTNVSSNVSRILDPKDIESAEISRGGYSAQFGDRTYGMINVIPRSGFEFEKEGELTLGFGSFHQTNDQVNFGGHSEKFAYYVSATGDRTDLGLEPPTEQVIHNGGGGLGFFTSMSYNLSSLDQLRLAGSARQDQYQIPNTLADELRGVRDADRERDSFWNVTWVHTYGPGTLLTVSPYYHYNRGQYLGGPTDPLITTSDRTSQYAGLQTTLALVRGKHNIHTGVNGFFQNDDALFGLEPLATRIAVTQHDPMTGGVVAAFVDDQYKPWDWLTLNGGLRVTHFNGTVNESAVTPRIGASVQIPHLKWVVRSYYGRYYQAPPLSTISGPILDVAATTQTFTFLPIRGERDEQREFGLTIPMRNWVLDLANFRTHANNFFDHDVLGNSDISLPLTVQFVRVRGWEATLRSPQLLKRLRAHLALSNQTVQGRGAVTGGLTDFKPPATDYFYIDHDQRVTLTAGADTTLPRRSWVSVDVLYGSGFLDVNGPAHLPQHVTGDFSFGKSFGERWSATVSALNISNTRYLLGRDSAFAGTHYDNPREITGQIRYRFHF